jgi:TPR repeat protein
VLKDYKQAVYWYQKAADQGYAEAQSNLGIAYAFGKGVLKDDKQSVLVYAIPRIDCASAYP